MHALSGRKSCLPPWNADCFPRCAISTSDGDALLVTGPNGTGKSSLLRVLAGLLPALRGEMRWGGEAVDWHEHRTRLHYIGHQDAVKPELTVAEMLDYWRALRAEKGALPRYHNPLVSKN